MAEINRNGDLVIGDFVLTFDRDEIVSDEYKELAERELRETPEVRTAAVATLREMLREDEEFDFPLEGKQGDEILIQFLRPCKFYPESALQKMKHFFAFKFNNPKYCGDLLCKADKNVFDQNMMTIVPSKDQHGRCILQLEIGTNWIPKKCSITELVRGWMILNEGSTMSPTNQIVGGIVIIDCDGLALTHVFQVTPSLAMSLAHYVQDCLPFRLKAMHIVNQSKLFNMVYAIFKPFLNSKLRSRIHFHGRDRDSLLQHIDAASLPVKYGGDLEMPELPGERLYEFLSSHKQSYDELAALGYKKKPRS